MKVLQLCNKPPYPPIDGGTLAINSITQGLMNEGCEVRVLSVTTDKHPVREQQMTDEYRKATHFKGVYVDLRVRVLDAMVAMLCGESYHVKRYRSKEFEEALIEILKQEEFDVVHIESVFLTPYVETVRKYSNAKVILRAHNVEHEIWRRMSKGMRNLFKKWYLKRESVALGYYEREHANDYDGVVCITARDAEYFKKNGCRRPITDVAFGITADAVDNVEEEENSLFHIGSMDWMPNQEGIAWFLSKVWPVVHQQVPEVRMYLAGRKMSSKLQNSHYEGVEIIGEVPDAMYFIGSKQINVVPLLSGSGIRVKIIEAMSVGKVVITTHVGAEGINYEDGKNILIANTPEEFAKQIRRCVDDKDWAKEIGRNAAVLVEKEYGNGVLTKRLLEFYQSLKK